MSPRKRGSEPKGIAIWRWPLPKDVRRALVEFGLKPEELLKESPDNPALLLQRYIPFPAYRQKEEGDTRADGKLAEDELKGTFGEWGWPKERELRSAKADLWRAIVERVGSGYQDGLGDLFRNLKERQKGLLKDLELLGYKVRCLPPGDDQRLMVEWRLIVGLGLPSSLETGITLHHLYGFPYLPGSAIKGVTRGWKLQQTADKLGIPRFNAEEYERWKKEKEHNPTPWELLEQLLMSPLPKERDPEDAKRRLWHQISQRLGELQKALKKARESGFLPPDSNPKVLSFDPKDVEGFAEEYIEKFSRAFGSTEAKGEVIFLDAYPEGLVVDGKPILELDVMTPHYGNYYTGDEPPADWLSPKPVQFLVVRRKTAFKVCLACRDGSFLEEVAQWTEKALEDLGIGAKTRAGYGELKVNKTGAPTPGAGVPSSLALAVERWSARGMGTLPQLVEQIASLPDPEERRSLGEKLKRKLQEVGRWGGKYSEKSWYQKLKEMTGG